MKVLVADDNVDGAASLAALLACQGHEVRVCYDGQSALEAAGQFRPQAALLDIGMPQLTGHEVARQIRLQSWSRETLLVAMSGWGASRDKDLARRAGFDYHLTKPLDVEPLLNLLEENAANA
jgi:DNA-binding response OmpR family regulator